MTHYDIIAIGGAMRDILFYTDEGLILDNPADPLRERVIAFELGAKVYIKQVYFEAGGGANNTATGFSKLGLKTGVVLRVGQDREGDALIKEMKKNGLRTNLVQRDKQVSTGFSFILSLSRKKGHTIFAYRGANDCLEFPKKIHNEVHAKWIYISSLSCPGWKEVLNRIFEFKNSNNILFAWNPANVQLRAGYNRLAPYLKQVDVLIINEDEARELVLSMRRIDGFSVRQLLKEIHSVGPKIVAITVGPRGAYAYDSKKVYYQREMSAKTLNATGAGDSFSAGFVSSLFHKPGNIPQALRWGVANSTSVIKTIGAQKGLLTKSQMRKYNI